MRNNPKEGELDPAEGVRRLCKKNSPSVLSCIGKRTKEGCYRGIEVWTVYSGRGSEGSVRFEKTEGNWQGENCKKDFVFKQHCGRALSLQ